MKRFLITILAAMAAGATARSATVAYLRVGTPGAYAAVTGAVTDATGTIKLTAANHGFITGDMVSVLGVEGCYAANGRRMITALDTSHFLIRSAVPANGAVTCATAYVSGGWVGKVAAHTLRDHPRLFLDGPAGALTGALTTKAVDTNVPWKALADSLTTYITSGCPANCAYADFSKWNGDDGRANSGYFPQAAWTTPLAAALAWKGGGSLTATQRQQALDAARFIVNNAEKTSEFTTGCNETNSCGDRDGTDYGSYYQMYIAAAFSIIHDQLTPAERTAFANKMLNDKEDNCVNLESAGPGTITTGGNSVPNRITGVGTHFTSLHPFDVVLVGNGRFTYMVKTVESDTSLLATNTVSAPYTNTAYDISTAWVSNACGYNFFLKHHLSTPKFLWHGFDYKTLGLDAHEGNNRTLTKIAGFLLTGLALADDDPRGLALFEEAYNYWYDAELRYGKDFYTGYTNGGMSYSPNRNLPYQYMITLSALNSIASPALTYQNGVWLKRGMMMPIFMRDPSSATDKYIPWGYIGNSQDMTPWRNIANFMGTYLYSGSDEARYSAYFYRNMLKDPFNPAQQMWTSSSMQNFIGGAAAFAYVYTSPTDATLNVPSNLPTQYLFNDTDINPDTALGNLVSRTGWTSTSDTLLFFQGWAQTQFDHQQNVSSNYIGNHGSYKITKKAALLTEDYDGSGDMETSNYLEIGGYGKVIRETSLIFPYYGPFDVIQKNRIIRWSGVNPTGDPSNKYVYAMGDFSGAYQPAAGISRITRQIAHMKDPGTQDYIVAYDDVEIAATSPGQGIRTFLHYANNGQTGEGTTIVTADGNVVSAGLTSKLSTQIFSPGGSGTIRIFTGDNVSATGSANQALGNYALGANTTYRVGICRSADAGATCDDSAHNAEFIVVHNPSANVSAAAVRTSQIAAIDANFRGIQIDDPDSPKVVLFGRLSALYPATGFTTTSAGVAQILVTGLSAGSYDIYKDHALLQQGAVVDSGSSVYFESGSGSFQIVPANSAPPLMISSSSSITSIADSFYSQALAVSGGFGTNSWSLTSGSLPAGMTLTGGGLLSGTPITPGLKSFSITASDSWTPPTTVAQTFTFNVRPDIFLQTLGVGGNSALLAYRRQGYSGTCLLELSRQNDFSVIDQSTNDTPGAGSRLKGWASLLPSTGYYQRVTCEDVVRTSQFTTLASSGASTIAVPFTGRPPTNRAVHTMVVDYGVTASLGSSAQSTCAVDCSVTIQTAPASLLWLRRRYLDGAGNVVAASSTHPIFTAGN